MALDLRAPGVYLEERFVRAPVGLPTGVPAFVGFGWTKETGADGQVSQAAWKPVLLVHPDQVDLDQPDRCLWVPRVRGSYVAAAVKGFFANGGKRCYVMGTGDPALGTPPLPPVSLEAPTPDADGGQRRLSLPFSGLTGYDGLSPLEDLDLVAVPDAALLLDEVVPPEAALEAVVAVQVKVLEHCQRMGDRVALLDPPFKSLGDEDPVPRLGEWRVKLVAGGWNVANAAAYYPWVRPASDLTLVPPCGHAAGIIARSDAQTGVFKAPANEELMKVVDLAADVDLPTHGELNLGGINCLRAIPGRGLRVLGARTLSQDPSWRYLHVRRTFLTLARWIDQNMAWAAFEPNTPRLWNRIQRELGAYLEKWWRAGALQGATTAEAYFVRCDAETNPQESRELGQVITQVGLAPVAPAELIVVTITQRAGATQLS